MGMLTLLAACNGPVDPEPGRIDLDQDGVVASADCADDDPTVHPGAPEVPEDNVDQDCDGVDPLAARTYAGARADEGYGSRILVTAFGLVVGAPFRGEPGGAPDGRVYTGETATQEGGDGAMLGAALAGRGDGSVILGAPGIGAVRTLDGETLLAEDGLGGVLAARGDHWVASTAIGAVREDGARLDWDRRPDALALDEDATVWAGFARGDIALRAGDRTVSRASATDEAGFAFLLADVGADGEEDLVVGAPGAGFVYVLDPAALPASLAEATAIGPGAGRFGAALAVGADGVLYVGAPMAGESVAGAVYAVAEGSASERWTGDAPGDQLGFSLAAGRASLAMGAPGAADAVGSVRTVLP